MLREIGRLMNLTRRTAGTWTKTKTEEFSEKDPDHLLKRSETDSFSFGLEDWLGALAFIVVGALAIGLIFGYVPLNVWTVAVPCLIGAVGIAVARSKNAKKD